MADVKSFAASLIGPHVKVLSFVNCFAKLSGSDFKVAKVASPSAHLIGMKMAAPANTDARPYGQCQVLPLPVVSSKYLARLLGKSSAGAG